MAIIEKYFPEGGEIRHRGGMGIIGYQITEKTGKLVSIQAVTDDNDLVIINKSGITLRVSVSDFRVMGRATQGVKLINLEKRNDQIGSICKVDSVPEDIPVEGGDENASETATETPITE